MEFAEQGSCGFPCCLYGSCGGGTHEVLEFGEDLFDWVEIRTVGRQEEELCSGPADGLSNRLSLVRAEIVHDDDVAGRERGNENLLDIGCEASSVDGAVEHAGRIDAVAAQRRDRVSVFQWPCGTLACSLWPRGAQPRIGAMLVLAQVSSMNTSRRGSRRP